MRWCDKREVNKHWQFMLPLAHEKLPSVLLHMPWRKKLKFVNNRVAVGISDVKIRRYEMKKKCAIFLTLIFILQGILVSAAERITVRVTVSGKTVTISGQLQKPKDNAVGILVTNRNGDIIYAAQTDIDTDGNYSVSFIPASDEREEYKVQVSATGEQTSATTGFAYGGDSAVSPSPSSKPERPSLGGGGGGGGSVITGPAPTELPELPPEETDATFTDIAGHWAESNIMSAFQRGLAAGKGENTFQPDAQITRAEFAAFAARVLGLEQNTAYVPLFADVAEGQWYTGVVLACAHKGILAGADGLFRPEDRITREEMAKIIVSAYLQQTGGELETEGEPAFTDEISTWAVPYVNAAVEAGLMKGTSETAFSARAFATRAEAVTVINRLYDLIHTEV